MDLFYSPTTTYSLRDYQGALIQEIYAQWKVYRRVLAQMPTGAGKTIVFAAIAREFIQRSETVLVIAHREELISQAAAKLQDVSGHAPAIIKAGYKPDLTNPVQVASIQSLVRRQLPPAALVIVDEAHHSAAPSYSKIIQHYSEQGSYVLGVTATPARIDGRGLRHLHDGIDGYEALAIGPSTKELIEAGHLSPFKIYASPNALDATHLRTLGGDYNESELEDFVRQNLIIGDVVSQWQLKAAGRRTVLFAVSVKHAQEIAVGFRQAGIPAESVSGDTPMDIRRQILARFAAGQTLVLCQHSIVVEGVDIPCIEAVQFCRPTKSLVVWFQAIGRALRPAPGKEHAVILDHTINHKCLPWPTKDISWSLDPLKIEANDHTHTCPFCHHVYCLTPRESQTRLTVCPSCQREHELPPPKNAKVIINVPIENDIETVLKDVDFVEIRDDEDAPEVETVSPSTTEEILEKLIVQMQARQYKPGWLLHRIEDAKLLLNLEQWKKVEKACGYKRGWSKHRYDEQRRKAEPPAPPPSPKTPEEIWKEALAHIPDVNRRFIEKHCILKSFSQELAIVEAAPVALSMVKNRTPIIQEALTQLGLKGKVVVK